MEVASGGVDTVDVDEYAKMGDYPRDKEIEKKDKENATKLDVTKADKMMNTPAYQKMKSGDPKYADKTEGMGDKIADMAQSMTKDEFMSHADELGLTPEEAAEHYEKMSGGAHAGKFEGNQFAQAVQKAKAAGMKSGDKFKVGDQEYTLKDAIELAGLQLEDFYSEEEQAYDNQINRIKNLALYQ
jgi:phage-related tail protein